MSVVVEWGDVFRSVCNVVMVVIFCKMDVEVEVGVICVVKGDLDGLEVLGGGVDFVWVRLRELEFVQGWVNRYKLNIFFVVMVVEEMFEV